MHYRTLGDSGLVVSVVGLGCNNFGGRLDAAQANAVVSAAIDEGITLLDTSDTYGEDGGSERALGEALDKVEALIDWGWQQGVSLLEIAIGGLAAQPGCSSVIAGATSPEQVKANAAAGRWEPTAEQLAAIDGLVPPPAA